MRTRRLRAVESVGDRPMMTCRVYGGSLRQVREQVANHARELLGEEVGYDFILAANEVATNVIVHGGGSGWLRMWTSGGGLVCEISDSGSGMADPRAGTLPPPASADGGYGMWLARELCRRVEVETAPGVGTTVWLHALLR